jgi:hypothetical protein
MSRFWRYFLSNGKAGISRDQLYPDLLAVCESFLVSDPRPETEKRSALLKTLADLFDAYNCPSAKKVRH